EHQRSTLHTFCKRCNYAFESVAALVRHTQSNHRFPCMQPGCAFVTRAPKELMEHQMALEHLYCREHRLTFTSEQEQDSHHLLPHKPSGTASSSIPERPPTAASTTAASTTAASTAGDEFTCPVHDCGFTTSSQQAALQHKLDTHHLHCKPC